jgi:7-keto-8-aminopelargonate synthetase-like enzyme
MVEANQRVYQIPTPNHAQRQVKGRAVRVLAIREAVKAVKQRMRSQGLKVQYVQRNAIVAAAEDYLAVHRSEPVVEATKIVERRHTEGAFGPRGGIRSRS